MCKVYYKSGMTLCVPRSFSCHFEMLNVWAQFIFFIFFTCAREYGTVQGTRLFRCLTNIFINEHLWCADEPCSMVNLYQRLLEHACLHRYYVHRATDATEYGKPDARINYAVRHKQRHKFTYKSQQNTQSAHEHTYYTAYSNNSRYMCNKLDECKHQK